MAFRDKKLYSEKMKLIKEDQECLNNPLFMFSEYFYKNRCEILEDIKEICDDNKSMKDTGKAMDILNDVDLIMKSNQFNVALQVCNCSLMTVEQSGIEFVQVLIKRAEIYLKLKEYLCCELDCLEVLKILPDLLPDIKLMIYLMLCECYAELGKDTELTSIINALRQDLTMTDQNKDSFIMYNQEVKKIEILLKQYQETVNNNKSNMNMKHEIKTIEQHLEKLKKNIDMSKNDFNLANYVSLMRDKEGNKGRFLQVNRDVNPGEVLIIEKAYAHAPVFCTLHDTAKDTCFYCLNKIKRPIPCKSCRVLFCGEKCRDLSTKLHQFECKGFQSGFWYNAGAAFLGFRAAFNCIEYLKRKLNKQESYMETLNAQINNEELCKEILNKSSQVVVYLEENTQYFEWLQKDFNQDNIESLDDIKNYVGAKIFKHTAQVMSNASQINIEPSYYDYFEEENTENKTVATGFFPSYCMMNHSCKPNISITFYGDTVVVKAMELIKKGEEVFNCYGAAYNKERRIQRQAYLKKTYDFNCECIACKDPAGDKVLCNTYKCPKCSTAIIVEDDNKESVICTNCKSTHDLEDYFCERTEICMDIHIFQNKPSNALMDSMLKRLLKLCDESDKLINWCFNRIITFNIQGKVFHKALDYHKRFYPICCSVYGTYSKTTYTYLNRIIGQLIYEIRELAGTQNLELDKADYLGLLLKDEVYDILVKLKEVAEIQYTPLFYEDPQSVFNYLNLIDCLKKKGCSNMEYLEILN